EAWPFARLRARGELVEIRGADLRFTPDEASTDLIEMMGLRLGPREIAALRRRAEGWIAVLQLAALSMQGRSDVAGFIESFAGDDRYIVDYLVLRAHLADEQPEHVRELHRLASAWYERNDVDAAAQHLQRSQELGEHAGLPQLI